MKEKKKPKKRKKPPLFPLNGSWIRSLSRVDKGGEQKALLPLSNQAQNMTAKDEKKQKLLYPNTKRNGKKKHSILFPRLFYLLDIIIALVSGAFGSSPRLS